MYKNKHSILGLIKGRCKFTTSDFPKENPRTLRDVKIHILTGFIAFE
jgi:hypothetical protein